MRKRPRKRSKRRRDPLNAGARTNALLKAIPDLMFVLKRDGTYVDYHARNPQLLFAPPTAFLGKTVRDVMPPPLAEVFMEAIERTCQGDDTVVIEYRLPLDKPTDFEARIVRAGEHHVITTVRDVTDLKHMKEVNRDLAGRLIASQEAERHRIARELHDGVSQRIAVMKMTLDFMAMHDDSPEARTRLEELSGAADGVLRDLHDVAHALHPVELEVTGLAAATEKLCRDLSKRASVNVRFTPRLATEDIDTDVALCLYRVAQEALRNVVQHSRAREAHVRLTEDSGHLTLEISDVGVGFDPERVDRSGLGLLSMRERVTLLGGQLTIHTRPRRGTRLSARVPMR